MNTASSEAGAAASFTRSFERHADARHLMPDGVGAYSQYRDPHPIYIARAEGARLYDVDGNAYVDYMLGAGPAVLGHRHPAVVAAVQGVLDAGLPNIAVCDQQFELADLLCRYVPSLEQVRFMPTGTEAVQAAIRLARAVTGRPLIAKFEGAYHGQAENVMVSVDASAERRGPRAAPHRVPYHCMLPQALAELTVVLPFNDIEATTRIIEEHANDIALVLVEPMLGFAGAVPAEPDFLSGLREVTSANDILLAFDEVITGFRVALGGGQAYYDVRPDLTILGKAIGGGMPLAAYGGRAELMEHLSTAQYPRDYVFQSGTFSAFPMSLAAGVATVRTLAETDALERMVALGEETRKSLRRVFAAAGRKVAVTGIGSLFHVHFTDASVRSAREAEDADQAAIRRLHQRLLSHGVYFYGGRLGFLSAAHTPADIEAMATAVATILDEGLE